MKIIIDRKRFNGSPVFINGKPLRLVPGVAIEVPDEYLDVIKRAGIPYRPAPSGSPTGRVIISADLGPRVPVALNGKAQFLPTDVPITLGDEQKAILSRAGIPFEDELNGGGTPTRQSIGLMTDLDSDIDDVVAQALLFDLLDEAGGSLAYVSVASRHPDAAHAQRVLLNAAGRSSVPVGQMETPVSANSTSLYATPVANLLPPKINRTGYPSSVSVMRQALAAMPDKSHKIITIGNLTDYAALLQSSADIHSPLTGIDLVAAKVISVHSMGGRDFPLSATYEANANGDEGAANYAASNTPVPIYWAQYSAGGDVMTRIVTTRTAASDPYGVAWDAYGAVTRASWDSIPVLHALLGLNGWFDVSEPGDVAFGAGTNWTAAAAGKNYYLSKNAEANTVRDYINGRVDAFMSRYSVRADDAPSSSLLATFDEGGDGADLATVLAQTGQSWRRAAASVGHFKIAAATGTIYSTTSPTLYEVADYKTGADLNIEFDVRRIDNESGTLHVRFHVVDDTNYLTIGHSGSTGWRIGQKINGISTTLATIASNMSVGQDYTVRAEVRDGLVDMIVNGSPVLTDVAIPDLGGRKCGLEGNWTMTATKSVHFGRVAVETISSTA